jgi:hypothetical protein
MGKKSDPPPPPDPREVGAAQTGQNVGTAIANTMMGQVNQVGPDGSLTYDQTDSFQWRDPNSGQMYTIPRFTATTTLSEDAQQLRDLDNQSNIALGQLGLNAANRADDWLGEDFTLDGVTPRADRTGMGPVEYGSGPDAPALTGDNRSLPTFTDLQTGYENDFGGKQQEMENMLFDRLNQQGDRDLESLRSRLRDQGVIEGSEMYSRAMEDYNRNMDDRRLGAMSAGLDFTERMTGMSRDEAAFGNAAIAGNNAIDQTLFGMGSDQLSYNNNIAQQGFGNEMALTDRSDRNANANFNEARILADDQDRARASELDEQAWLRSRPINEIAALMSGTQVQTPNFAIAQPYAMPTTDIAGITQQGYNNQMSAYNAQQQQQQAMMGGLFGLGGAALGSPWLFNGGGG